MFSTSAWADRVVTDQIGRQVHIPDVVNRVIILQHQTLNVAVQLEALCGIAVRSGKEAVATGAGDIVRRRICFDRLIRIACLCIECPLMGSSPDDVDPVTPHALISHDVPHMQGHVRFHRPAVFYNKVLWKMVDDARDDLFVVYNDRFATDQAIDQTGIARHVAVFAKPIGYEVQLRIRRQIG